jgi:hypothetical protein
MELLDVNDLDFRGKKSKYYDVKYRDKTYRRHNSLRWSALSEGIDGGYWSVELGFQIHLEKAWQKVYGDKNIYKKIEIIIE